MVAGFRTSPYDQLMIVWGEARLMPSARKPLDSTHCPPRQLDGEQATDRFLSTTTVGTTSWHSKTSAGGPFASSAVRAGRAGGVFIHVGYIISRQFGLSRPDRRAWDRSGR